MPARKINYTAGQIDNSKSHGNYLSQHSDKEYEILRDAFLELGEECDGLRLQVESLSVQCEDSRSDYYKLEAKYHKLEADYNVGDCVRDYLEIVGGISYEFNRFRY